MKPINANKKSSKRFKKDLYINRKNLFTLCHNYYQFMENCIKLKAQCYTSHNMMFTNHLE